MRDKIDNFFKTYLQDEKQMLNFLGAFMIIGIIGVLGGGLIGFDTDVGKIVFWIGATSASIALLSIGIGLVLALYLSVTNKK